MLDFPKFYPDQVVPPERFGDREAQRRQIEHTLQAVKEGRPRGAMICGERGIGKSSLLDKTRAMALDQKILPLHIALHEFENVKEFYDTIFEEIGIALKKIDLWEKLRVIVGEFSKEWDYIVRVEKRPGTLQGEVESRFGILFEKMKKRGYSSIVFLLDESDGLKKHVVGLQILRNVWTSICQRGYNLGFFFAGAQNLVESLGQYSPLKRHCIPINLKRFNQAECIEVIDKLEEGYKRRLSTSIKTRIAELSGGYPHYIHVLGSYAVEAMQAEKKDVWGEAFRNYLMEVDDYESVVTRADRLPETQRKIVVHMDSFGSTTPKQLGKKTRIAAVTIPTHLKRLTQGKIVKKVGRGKYEVLDRNLAEFLRISNQKN